MKKRFGQFSLSLILMLTLTACNLELVESQEGADILLTITANAAILEAAGQPGTEEPLPLEGDVAPPADEVVIPAQVLPPATGDVTVTVSVATNCRLGPGQNFASVYGMPVGQVAKVVAKNSYSGYWIIEIPGQNGQTCWLWGQYATISGDSANLKDVVTPTSAATQKPTATNTPSASATATSTTSAGAPAVAGCTDPAASNYNSAATVNDGSCIYTAQVTITGCTDPAATNYNSKANSDDGSCVYQKPPNVVILNSSVTCTDQLDGTFQFQIIIDWTDTTSAPNDGRRYTRSTKWFDQNGNQLKGSGGTTSLAQSHRELTDIQPAGATYSFTVTSGDGTSQASASLTCP
ncbi:MAG: hypothetical protein HS100_02410 [Anaerolineales bacterium]|nr:hypothetical protein [Anaerolineales bacterium]